MMIITNYLRTGDKQKTLKIAKERNLEFVANNMRIQSKFDSDIKKK